MRGWVLLLLWAAAAAARDASEDVALSADEGRWRARRAGEHGEQDEPADPPQEVNATVSLQPSPASTTPAPDTTTTVAATPASTPAPTTTSSRATSTRTSTATSTRTSTTTLPPTTTTRALAKSSTSAATSNTTSEPVTTEVPVSTSSPSPADDDLMDSTPLEEEMLGETSDTSPDDLLPEERLVRLFFHGDFLTILPDHEARMAFVQAVHDALVTGKGAVVESDIETIILQAGSIVANVHLTSMTAANMVMARAHAGLLAVMFNNEHMPASLTGSDDRPSHHVESIEIVVAAVGGVVLLALLIAIVVVLLRRRRRGTGSMDFERGGGLRGPAYDTPFFVVADPYAPRPVVQTVVPDLFGDQRQILQAILQEDIEALSRLMRTSLGQPGLRVRTDTPGSVTASSPNSHHHERPPPIAFAPKADDAAFTPESLQEFTDAVAVATTYLTSSPSDNESTPSGDSPDSSQVPVAVVARPAPAPRVVAPPVLAWTAPDEAEAVDLPLIHWAVQLGKTRSLHCLLRYQVDVNEPDAHGRTPLMLACLNTPALVNVLLTKGADPNLRDEDGATSLILAARRGSVDSIKALLKANADPSLADSRGMTALMHSASNNMAEAADLIARKRNSAINSQDINGWTALHWAVAVGATETVQRLLQYKKLELCVVNHLGESALHLAARSGRVALAQALVGVEDAGKAVSLLALETTAGFTATDYAANAKCDALVVFLTQARQNAAHRWVGDTEEDETFEERLQQASASRKRRVSHDVGDQRPAKRAKSALAKLQQMEDHVLELVRSNKELHQALEAVNEQAARLRATLQHATSA